MRVEGLIRGPSLQGLDLSLCRLILLCCSQQAVQDRAGRALYVRPEQPSAVSQHLSSRSSS